MSPRKRYWTIGVVVAALLVNLPLAHVWWSNYRLDQVGQVATATVTGAHAIPAGGGDEGKGEDQRYFVVYELPKDADPAEGEYNGQVDRTAYDEAKATKRIEVEYLPGSPDSNRPVAQVSDSNVALVITIFADLTLLAIVALMLWARRNAVLSLLATGDVRRCKPDPVVQELGGGLYLVRGDVLEIGEGEVVLEAMGRQVRVVLGEFENPVGHQQPAEVRGRRIPRR